MKLFLKTFLILITVVGCRQSDPDPSTDYTASAILNDQPWGGIAMARRNSAQQEPCGNNTFYLSIQNKEPHPKRARQQATSLCAGYCGDQSLNFTRIPLAIGTYPLSIHQLCEVSPAAVGVSFTTLIGGDVLVNQYLPDGANAGTVEITYYDAGRAVVEGRFQVRLRRDSSRRSDSGEAAEAVRFQRGLFKVTLP